MIEHNITQVNPTLFEGRLFSLQFTVTATENDLNATIVWHTPTSLPEREEPYTQEDFAALAGEIALQQGLYDRLNAQIEAKKAEIAPVVTPPITPPASTLTPLEQRNKWMTQIDTTIASVYNQFTRFQLEYELREAAALAYKNGDYTGEPTMWIKSFADNTGISYRQCADVVLSQADKLRGAVALLGILRMDKYRVLSAPTLEDAQIAFNKIIDQVKHIAGSL